MKHSSLYRPTLGYLRPRLWSAGVVLTGMLASVGCASDVQPEPVMGSNSSASGLNSGNVAGSQTGPSATGMGEGEEAADNAVGAAGMSMAPALDEDDGPSADSDAGLPEPVGPEVDEVDPGCAELSYDTFGEEFITTYCSGCHGGINPMGGFTLTSEDDINARMAGALRQVESGGMPRGNTLPSSDERATFVTWLQCELGQEPTDPGATGGGGDLDVDEGVDEEAEFEDADFAEDEDLDDDEGLDDDFDEDLDDELEEAEEDLDDELEEAEEDLADQLEEAEEDD